MGDNEIVKTGENPSGMIKVSSEFNDMHPRSIFIKPSITKTADSTGGMGMTPSDLTGGSGMSNIFRNPSRRFYDPRYTATSMYMPRSSKDKNMWNRWFYDHDPLIGAVLDLHAELPHSQAEFLTEDSVINRHINDCVDRVNLFAQMPQIDLEYMKIGEVFIHTPWNDKLGMWEDIIIHNPDYVEVTYSPFAERESLLELIPSDELKKIIYSTKPEDQPLKRRIPKEIMKRVLTGKNILLDNKEVTHIARKSNPYDERGSSILQRIYRDLMLEDKYREFQQTSVDSLIYPLKIFKLGDKQKGWIPNKEHQESLAQMLSQANMDPNFSLIYHYGLEVEAFSVVDKLMKLDSEWAAIDKRKMTALGVSEAFINGSSTYSCFVEGTKITTPTGFKNIEEIKIGDEVIDKNGYIKKVIDNWNEGVPEEVTEIHLWGGKKLISTNNHKHSAWIWPRKCACGCETNINNGRTFERGHGRWSNIGLKPLPFIKTIKNKYCKGLPTNHESIQKVEAENIKQYDFMMIPRKFEEIIPDCSLDQARLLGYFVSEGNYSKHHTTKKKTGLNFTFSINEENTLVKDCLFLCNLINLPVSSIENRNSSLRIRTVDQLQHVQIINWFYKHGKEYSHGKELSQEVMQWPLNYKKELIRGMFRGDGCQKFNNSNGGQPSVHYTTVSEKLAYQTELILAQLGFAANLVTQHYKETNRKKVYRLDIYGKTAQELAYLVWGEDSKFKNLDTNNFRSQKYWIDDNYIYIEVMSVKKIKNDKKVFNLTVEGTHSYLANNIATYNSANVGLQTQLARYKAKRDLLETRWLQDKFFKGMAERNEWYTREKREIVGQYRVKRTGSELEDRLILPKIVWHKKLMMRDDQSYLNFLNNVYAAGKGPISTITLLMQMGLDPNEELSNKKKIKEMEDRIGEYFHPPVEKVATIAPVVKKEGKGFFDKFKIGKDKTIIEVKQVEEPNKSNVIDIETLKKELENPENKALIESAKKDFVGLQGNKIKTLDKEEILERENTNDIESAREVNLVDNQEWYKNIQSPNISSEVIMLLTSHIKKLTNILKKYDNFSEGIDAEKNDIIKILSDLYLQGKLTSYSHTNYLPIQKEVYSNEIQDYSDMFLFNEFEDWISQLSKINVTKDSLFKIMRDLSNTCYSYGQLKGFKEQGIENAKVFNVFKNEGLQYPVNKLLNKGWNLSNVISPSSEIIILIPCIEGYENTALDPYIKKSTDMFIGDIDIKGCPVEHAAFFERFINKFGKYIKKKYNTITFVNDVVDLKEWEQDTLDRFKKTSQDEIIVQNKVLIERTQKIGSVPSYQSGKNLFISNWIFKNESLVTGSLINLINIYDEIEKPINKIFKEASYDLGQDEIDTYRLLNYIEPIQDEKETVFGWKISEFIPKDTDYRLLNGKVWDVKGKCSNKSKSAMQIFNDNVKLWLFYPQRMDDNIKKYFELL